MNGPSNDWSSTSSSRLFSGLRSRALLTIRHCVPFSSSLLCASLTFLCRHSSFCVHKLLVSFESGSEASSRSTWQWSSRCSFFIHYSHSSSLAFHFLKQNLWWKIQHLDLQFTFFTFFISVPFHFNSTLTPYILWGSENVCIKSRIAITLRVSHTLSWKFYAKKKQRKKKEITQFLMQTASTVWDIYEREYDEAPDGSKEPNQLW